MKKLLISIFCLLLITGCSNYTELNELLVVTAIGIDYKDDNYIVYLSTVDGKLDEKEIEKEYVTYKSTGKTILEAFNRFYQEVDKKIYLSHLDLLVLSNEALTSNLKDIVKTFLYDIENRSSFKVITTDDISTLFNLDDFTNKISNFSTTNAKELSAISTITFDNFSTIILEENYFILPNIKLEDNNIIYQGGILINKNKDIEKINVDLMIIYNYLTNNITRTMIDNINVLSNYTTLRTSDNQIFVNIISDVYDKDAKKYPKILKEKINAFLDMYYKDKKIDILNLEKRIYQNHYHYYKDNKNNLLNLLNFNITIKTSSVLKEVNYEK